MRAHAMSPGRPPTSALRSGLGAAAAALATVWVCLSPAQALADEDTRLEAARDAAARQVRQEVPDLDLDKRIRPVSGRLLRKAGRQELSPDLGISLGDPFFTKYLLGARYTYHLGEQWAVGAGGYWVESVAAGSVTKCDAKGLGCEKPSKEDLGRAPGDFGLLVGGDVTWSPLYGKISVLAEGVLHFDTYVTVGGGVLQTRHVPPGETTLQEGFAPHGSVAIGQRFYMNRNTTLRLELRDVIYPLEIQGRDGPTTSIQNQLLFTVGVSFFFGQGQGA